jgi:hypothetical protein
MEKSFVREFTGFSSPNNDFLRATEKNGDLRSFKDEYSWQKYLIFYHEDQ